VFAGIFVSKTSNPDQDSSSLCKTDLDQVYSYGTVHQKPPTENLKLFVWNVAKFKESKALDDLFNLASASDVIFLQEATHSTVYQAAFEEKLETHAHHFYPSFCDKKAMAFGVQISTSLNTINLDRWPSPENEPLSTIKKMSGYSLVEWNNDKIHLINTHALNFNAGGKFERQIDDLVEKIKQLEGPLIWAGDFNTWIPLRKNYLFSKAAELGLIHIDPEDDHRKLILDHIFYRGLNLKMARMIDMDNSDHDAIVAEFTP
jgi:endonuclease/exonuclease/phosphatase (EEP) superfamily protein YafD